MKKIAWITLGIVSMAVGLYPGIYLLNGQRFFVENEVGLLATKSPEVLSNFLWNISFYTHITFGGLALLIGWLQFNGRLRVKRTGLHRIIGKIYVISALASGTTGIYLAFFATGGPIAVLGFATLGVVWTVTTALAFHAIRMGSIHRHEKLMVFSYAACFAAVTLRAWLPLLENTMGDFIDAYRVVAWLCWLPNMLFALYRTRLGKPSSTVLSQRD